MFRAVFADMTKLSANVRPSHRCRFGFTSFWTKFGSEKSSKTTLSTRGRTAKRYHVPKERWPVTGRPASLSPGFRSANGSTDYSEADRDAKGPYKCRVNGDCAKHEIASVRVNRPPYDTPSKCVSLDSFWRRPRKNAYIRNEWRQLDR